MTTEEVLRHWNERFASSLVAEEVEISGYRHVPLEKVGTIRVRYKKAKPLMPRRFPVEDE